MLIYDNFILLFINLTYNYTRFHSFIIFFNLYYTYKLFQIFIFFLLLYLFYTIYLFTNITISN